MTWPVIVVVTVAVAVAVAVAVEVLGVLDFSTLQACLDHGPSFPSTLSLQASIDSM